MTHLSGFFFLLLCLSLFLFLSQMLSSELFYQLDCITEHRTNHLSFLSLSMVIHRIRCLYHTIKILLLLSVNINASLFYLLPCCGSYQCSNLFVSKMMTGFNPHKEQANLLVGVRYEEFHLLQR